jgi:hypothetical protein
LKLWKKCELEAARLNGVVVRREKANAKKRQYRAKHREAVNARGRRYHAKHRDTINAKKRQYRAEHRDAINAKARQYHAKHRDAINAKARAKYAATKQLKTNHPQEYNHLLENQLQNRRREGTLENRSPLSYN